MIACALMLKTNGGSVKLIHLIDLAKAAAIVHCLLTNLTFGFWKTTLSFHLTSLPLILTVAVDKDLYSNYMGPDPFNCSANTLVFWKKIEHPRWLP